MSLSYSAPAADPDLKVLLLSVPEFADRLRQFKEAKAGAEKALADLNLGQVYANALDLQALAQKELAHARDLVDEAHNKARQIVADAQAEQARVEAHIAEIQARCLKYIEDTFDLKAGEGAAVLGGQVGDR
jgi:hypothetical protein